MTRYLITLSDNTRILGTAEQCFIDPTGALVLADHTMEICHAVANGMWLAINKISEARFQEILAAYNAKEEVPGEKPLDSSPRRN